MGQPGRLLRVGIASVLLWSPAPARGADDAGFETVAIENGFTIDRRPGQRSPCDEVRVSTVVAAPFDLVAAVIWDERFDGDLHSLVRYEVLLHEPDVKQVWGLLDVPIFADREYTARIERSAEDDGRVILVRFELEPDAPLRAGAVRLRTLSGVWRVGPAESGQSTRLEYRVEADPGGFPAWLTSRLQRDTALSLVRAAVAQSEARFAMSAAAATAASLAP